jgi:hypothetical protein
VSQRQQEITHPAREGSQRVIPSRLVGVAVAEEVRGDDREAFAERGQDETPSRRARGHAMDEHEYRPGPAAAITDAMAVDLDVSHFDRCRHGLASYDPAADAGASNA